jgi:hypothetical protein
MQVYRTYNQTKLHNFCLRHRCAHLAILQAAPHADLEVHVLRHLLRQQQRGGHPPHAVREADRHCIQLNQLAAYR